MAEACFTARSSTRNQVKEEIAKLTLVTNGQGQYQHNDIVTLIKGVQRVLKSPFNPSNPGNGMVILLEKNERAKRCKIHRCGYHQIRPSKIESRGSGGHHDHRYGPARDNNASRRPRQSQPPECHKPGGHWLQVRHDRRVHRARRQRHYRCCPPHRQR